MNRGDLKTPSLAKAIEKRWTLNMLIQGAASHTFVTAGYLVERELEAIRPGLTRLQVRMGINGQLNYLIGENAILFGRPNRWLGWSSQPHAAIADHRFLAPYANQLAGEEVKHLRRLGKNKGVWRTPMFQWVQMFYLFGRVYFQERPHRRQLQALAERVASEIWGFDRDKLDGKLTRQVAFGNLRDPKTAIGRAARNGAVGYSAPVRVNGQWKVIGKAWVFPLLVHELVKGIAELVCLHGMHHWDEAIYLAATEEADQLEYETWCIQAGPALWRRFLSVAPRDRSIARSLMRLASLPPDELNDWMHGLMTAPETVALDLAD